MTYVARGIEEVAANAGRKGWMLNSVDGTRSHEYVIQYGAPYWQEKPYPSWRLPWSDGVQERDMYVHEEVAIEYLEDGE